MSTSPRTPDYIGCYGPGPGYLTTGVLIDHDLHVESRTLASGNRVAVIDGFAYPILCGDIIEYVDEDGRHDGRCGGRIEGDNDACPGHQAQHDGWRSMSESELLDLERREEMEGSY